MPPTIGLATAAELPAVLALVETSGLPRAGLEGHLGATLVAREGREIVGSAALELYGHAALLRSVAVAPTHRGHGLGHALTRAALQLARERAVRTVYLLTETAADFFPRFGFRPIPRAEVDPAVVSSEEFTSACPKTALVMAKEVA
jgi:amino-acid N-acetyltransferase